MPDRPHRSSPQPLFPMAIPAQRSDRTSQLSATATDRDYPAPDYPAPNYPVDPHDLAADRRYRASQRPSPIWHLWLKNLALLTTGGVLFLTAFWLIGLWQSGEQLLQALRRSITLTTTPAQVDVRSIVVQQVRGASELTTAVYSMESVVPASRERTLGGYVIGKTTLLYIAHGEVRAGVDLSALQPQQIQVNGNQITLMLPPAQILDSKIDVNRSQVYDYDRGFLGLGPDVAPELQTLAQQETLQKIVQSACTDGILQSANDRAKLVVSQLLSSAGYPQVQIETQPPSSTACTPPAAPASPFPSPSAEPSLPVLPLPDPAAL